VDFSYTPGDSRRNLAVILGNFDILHGFERRHGYHYLLDRLPLASCFALECKQGRGTSAEPLLDTASGACSGLKINAMKPT